jgi:hypothetical protein
MHKYKFVILVQSNGCLKGITKLREKFHVKIRDDQIKYFYHVSDWVEELKHVDIVFGARIHGNLMAIAAGEALTINV